MRSEVEAAGNTARTAERLTTVFRVSIHLLLCVSALMLAAAEGRPFPVVLTIPLAIVALAVSAPGRGVHLPNVLANVAGAIALYASYWEFMSSTEGRLLSGAHLLVYLSWIVLYQDKQSGQYWWMCALSVLSVAVGALLMQTGEYGAWMMGFALLAVWSLSVFSVQRAYARNADPETPSETVEPRVPGPRAASRIENGVLLDERSGVLGARFLGGAFVMTCAAVVVSFFVFLMFPRLWVGQQPFSATMGGERSAGTALTGFSETVQLGGMGQILESNERVLEVRMFDQDSGQPIDVEEYALRLGYDEPYFRGKVLDTYEQGKWTTAQLRTPPLSSTPEPLQGTVRQEYRLQPTGTPVLFSMHPAVRTYVRLDAENRGANVKLTTFEFTIDTDSVPRGEPIEYYSFSLKDGRSVGQVYEPEPLRLRGGEFRRSYFTKDVIDRRLREYLDQETRRVAPAGGPNGPTSPAERAGRIVHYLRDSGEFGYSLQKVPPPPGTDPLMFFLSETRRGHCEYYASALALMLRTADVPARVVTGFKGGTRSTLTGYFEVEQRHAHAWVEAYLDGRWVVLDATPATERRESVASNARSLRSWSEFKHYVSDRWDYYVVRMTLFKQRDQFYKPLQAAARDAWKAISGDGQALEALKERLRAIARSPQNLLFSPVAFVASVIVMTSLAALWYGVARLVRFLRERMGVGDDDDARRRRIIVAFYERFVEICRRLQLERRPSQTPNEFATDVGHTLNPRLSAAGLGTFPTELVSAFYDVRFGDIALDATRLRHIDRQLTAMEQSLDDESNGDD